MLNWYRAGERIGLATIVLGLLLTGATVLTLNVYSAVMAGVLVFGGLGTTMLSMVLVEEHYRDALEAKGDSDAEMV